jgi:hypothetical protein
MGGHSFFGALVFIILGYPKDDLRALRSPVVTLRHEAWFSAHVAGWSIAALMVARGVVEVVPRVGYQGFHHG